MKDSVNDVKSNLSKLANDWIIKHKPKNDATCVLLGGSYVVDRFKICQHKNPTDTEGTNILTYSNPMFMQPSPRPVKSGVYVDTLIGINNRVNTEEIWVVGFMYNILIQNDLDTKTFIILDPFHTAYNVRREIPFTFRHFDKWLWWADTYVRVNDKNAPEDNPYDEDLLELMAFKYLSGAMCKMVDYIIKRGTDAEFIKILSRMTNDVLEYFMRYDWILDKTEDYPEKRMVLLREIQNRGMNIPNEYRL